MRSGISVHPRSPPQTLVIRVRFASMTPLGVRALACAPRLSEADPLVPALKSSRRASLKLQSGLHCVADLIMGIPSEIPALLANVNDGVGVPAIPGGFFSRSRIAPPMRLISEAAAPPQCRCSGCAAHARRNPLPRTKWVKVDGGYRSHYAASGSLPTRLWRMP